MPLGTPSLRVRPKTAPLWAGRERPARRGAFSAAPPRVSIVIPTHKGSQGWIGECLRALASQEGVRREVLLVLDGPAPRVSSLARGILPAARQLHRDRNQGFAVAASAGLKAAKAELVVLLNDDAVPQPGWLQALVDAADAWPDAGSFACRVLQATDPRLIDSAGHGLTRWGEPFAIAQGVPDGPRFDEGRWVFGAPACAAAFRRQLLLDCGGFDPKMQAYLEDVDLSLRAQVLGFPCRYVPTARVLHQGSASYGYGRGDGRAERLVARNRVRLILKSLPRNALRAALLPAAASIGLDLIQRAMRAQQASAVLRGTLEGLRDARSAVQARPSVLGGRRIDDRALSEVLRAAERDLVELGSSEGASAWRHGRGRLSAALAAWVDRREAGIRSTPFPYPTSGSL